LDDIRLAKQDVLRTFDDADSKFSQRQLAVTALGAVWGANVLHALISGPVRAPAGELMDRDLARWDIVPRLTPDATQVVLNHRF
jgi:hypothetical protein